MNGGEAPPPARVLHIFQPPVGGVPAYVAQLARGLVERGWTVAVACEESSEYVEAAAEGGAHVVRMPIARVPSPREDRRIVRRLCALAREMDADLIHAHSTKAGLLAAMTARRTGIPSIYTPHGWSFEMRRPLPARMAFAALDGFLVRRRHRHVIAVSRAERRVAERWRVLPRGRRSTVVLTAVAGGTSSVTEAEARRLLGVPQSRPVVAWVGRNDPQKRPGDLVRLAALLRAAEISLVVLGSGFERDGVAGEITRAGGIFAPSGTTPEIVYAAADVLVQTSEWEGLPLVVLEAMVRALPVVAYDVGGVREAVDHGVTGELVRPGDVDHAAAKAVRLCAESELAAAYGTAGRARVAEVFDRTRMLDEICRVYAAVIRESSRSPDSRSGKGSGAGASF